MSAIIEVRDLSKRFRQHKRFPGLAGAFRTLVTSEYSEIVAVDNISFDIQAGEALGYLGPNGAGKSTMIKMLTGILSPSGGILSVLGRAPHQHRTLNAREIGVVFGQRSQLWWDLPVIESLRLNQKIYRVADSRFRSNLAYFTDLLELGSFLDRPVRQLSLGQRMRCELTMALLHDPKILFLDEPTIGLDVVAKDVVRSFLARINRERGVTIILTTHDLVDIEQICPRLLMVDDGKLLYDGPLTRLRANLGGSRKLRLEFVSAPGDITLSGAELVSDEGLFKYFRIEKKAVSLISILAEIPDTAGLRDVLIEEPSIEEVIRSFYLSKPVAQAQ
jgi:ABC-2 type transport system ATP-binding protein